MKKVVIGIQARSTSKRMPGKIFKKIGGVELLQHAIDSAEQSIQYINRYSDRTGIKALVVVLCPHEDELVERYKHKVMIFEGEEDDVLSRYFSMALKFKPDYIVRLTADCPLIPPYLITKHINIATQKNLDYVSNVDQEVGMALDGHDVEVMSMRALEWAHTHAMAPDLCEHVTLVLRKMPLPPNFKVGHVIGHVVHNGVKLSVDTEEDLERVERHYNLIQEAIGRAQKKHGVGSVHRF